MIAAAPLPDAVDRLLTIGEQLDSPCVLVDFAPGASASARLEVYAPPHGPRASDVVRSVARALNTRPAVLDAEPDESTGDPSVFYVLLAEQRVARVYGLRLDPFIDAVISVAILDAPARLKARRAEARKEGWLS